MRKCALFASTIHMPPFHLSFIPRNTTEGQILTWSSWCAGWAGALTPPVGGAPPTAAEAPSAAAEAPPIAAEATETTAADSSVPADCELASPGGREEFPASESWEASPKPSRPMTSYASDYASIIMLIFQQTLTFSKIAEGFRKPISFFEVEQIRDSTYAQKSGSTNKPPLSYRKREFYIHILWSKTLFRDNHGQDAVLECFFT